MSASTMRARVRLGEEALAQLAREEAKMRAERKQRAQERLEVRSAEFSRLQVANSNYFAERAARCDALEGVLSGAEVAREQAAIAEEARRGARDAADRRLRELEERADAKYATVASQRFISDQILGRAGARVIGAAKEGQAWQGTVQLGESREMPLTIVSRSNPNDQQLEHEIVFENDTTSVRSCEEGEETIRRVVTAAGEQVYLEEPPDPRSQSARRRPKKRKQATSAKKTRRAG